MAQRDGDPPRPAARGPRAARPTAGASAATPVLRAIVYSPAPERQRWIEAELARARAIVQVARTLRCVLLALCDDPAPRPQVLVVDADSLTAAEVLQLHEVRARGWFGTIVALGRVAPALRRSLEIEHVLGAPFVEDALADALDKARTDACARTVPLPRFPV